MIELLRTKLQSLYKEANRRSGNTLHILRDTLIHFNESGAAQMAASIAYYIFFSLFPLLLLLISLVSLLANGDQQAYQETIDFLQNALPVSQQLVERNVRQVLKLRGSFSLVGLASLLWSTSGAFSTLSQNINRAWTDAEARNFLEKRLVGIGMVASIFLLLLLSLASTTLLSLLPQIHLPLGELELGALEMLGTHVLSWCFTFAMFLALYRWVPNTYVSWRAGLWGALIAGLGWEISKEGFAWYLRSGLVNYELVYGSLSAVVALLFWLYLGATITLFGAHLSASISRHAKGNG
ncbi:MAG: YihY/virulence factor BrkB family protein [Anaerolineae bacterium]